MAPYLLQDKNCNFIKALRKSAGYGAEKSITSPLVGWSIRKFMA